MLRLFVSLVLGATVMFALLFLMAKLIDSELEPPEKLDDQPVIDIIMSEPDENIQELEPPPPPPPPPPVEPPKVEIVEPQTTEVDIGFSMDVPSVDTGGTDVGIGPIGAISDGEATPIFRQEPKYPPEAARDGREGWVQLSFTINEVGGVEDVEVIAAEPKRIFDREARRALRKWKYKPKIEDGKPVKQFNQKVRLDFTLGDS